ncbi:methyltransferase [Xenorhabdus indica]|uniref:methyltransferase n=1 Tax=Xenorhabdus indica TaxID=333964 RepID=UPI00165695A8|nr:methyltransferase [Xenorhabdus indica]MBC8944757.1 phenazine-specific methyltransferase PhzM [Xenorhabdus indica]
MLLEIIDGYRQSAGLYAFVSSQVPQYLTNKEGKTLKQLSELCNVSIDRLQILLDYMLSLNVLFKDNEQYYLTEMCLSLSDPNSYETLKIKFELNPVIWEIWPKYISCLNSQHDESVFQSIHKESFYNYINKNENKELKSLFYNFMAVITDEIFDNIIKYIPMENVSSIIDVGGGEGNLTRKIKEYYPHLKCTVMDRYDFIEKELEDITFINGDFFSAIPAGYDIYFLKQVLRNWPNDKSTDILKNIHQAMRDDSILYVIDTIKEENNAKDISFHLFMDLIFRGNICYQSEYEELANNAGFYINNIYKITSSKHIIEMKKKT